MIHRELHDDAVAQSTRVSKVTAALFSTALVDVDLYNKPLAHNCQIWTPEAELILNGFTATPEDIRRAAERVMDGGLFRYFFRYPAMRVGRHEVYWHRPLAAYWSHEENQAKMLDVQLPGYFTAYEYERPDLSLPVELYPRLLARPAYLSALRHIDTQHDHYRHQTALNMLTILDMSQLWQGAVAHPRIRRCPVVVPYRPHVHLPQPQDRSPAGAVAGLHVGVPQAHRQGLQRAGACAYQLQQML